MEFEVQDPIGVRVTDATVEELSAELLAPLLAEHGVAMISGLELDDAGFVAFLRGLGPLTFTTGETAVDGFPDLNVVSNIGRTTPPKSSFHVDTSYVREPPAYTALRAVQVPPHGGETLFTNQYRAHDTLPPEVREELAGRSVTHVVTGLDLDGDAERSAEHPVFRPHPLTGRVALYLTTPPRCAAISGMAPADAEAMIAFLFAHSTAEENTHRHAWSPGDVVIWDNACVLHRADHAAVDGDRLMHRGMVARHARAAA